MPEWEAPAKLNLDLRVGSVERDGFHPLRSLVQTIDWTDRLTVEESDEDHLDLAGAELPEGGENLVWQAVEALALRRRPRLHIRLVKSIPIAAGLGGGSADAAATLLAVGEMLRLGRRRISAVAAEVGADVPFLLTGGTAVLEGYGERVTALDPLSGFAVAVAVPPFELATPDVYRRWDEMGGPVGTELTGAALPPALRRHDELRNDLTPAAASLRPELRDWMADLGGRWERPVMMSGSGPACFGFFLDRDEAAGAVAGLSEHRGAQAADLRRQGPTRVEE